MSSLIIMVVMACGFWYTDNHYPSRLRYARTHGWSSYFYIAMQGCKFVAQGAVITLLLYPFVILIILLFTPFHYASWLHQVRILNVWLWEHDIFSYPIFCVSTLMLAVVFTYVAGDVVRNMLKNDRFREEAYREVAALDDVESLLVQAIDREMLIFITLKSRKFYVGYVTAPRIEHGQDRHLALIPYISGYRDKETLRYYEQYRYYALYLAQGITANSAWLNLQHFRHVIPMNQIEAISLFDICSYRWLNEHVTTYSI